MLRVDACGKMLKNITIEGAFEISFLWKIHEISERAQFLGHND